MDRPTLSALAHEHHPISAPLSEASVDTLLDRAVRAADAHVLDLGCGEGAWLLRLLQAHPQCTAVGVDLSAHGFDRTRATANRLGVADRLTLHQEDVTRYALVRPADVVLSVGAAYAFGDLTAALAGARRHLAADGTFVFGECFWHREPSPELRAQVEGDCPQYTDLAGTVARVVADGWLPVGGHVSTLQEWDAYEWSWTGSLTAWALDHPGHPDVPQVLQAAAEHRDTWLRGYREVLGFVVMVLRPAPGPEVGRPGCG